MAQDANVSALALIVVTDQRFQALPGAENMSGSALESLRRSTSDTASLLRSVPGLETSGAGGVSSLPVIHGLADDRIRTKVDGIDFISACANHMNPPLSYIDPSNVGSIKVFAGITPVSVGGDSIGGTIIVNSKAPRFANAGEGLLTSGELGGFYRSNGDAHGANLSATMANENLSLSYNGSTAQSNNYKSAKDFKAGTQVTWTTAGSHWIAGDEVGSSAYKTENHALDFALRHENHLFDLKLGYQHIPYQGFPNQHMDMTDNQSAQINLAYIGKFQWGTLEARVYNEKTRHKMDFADDKLYWYGTTHNVAGMPMDTEGKNSGALLKAEIDLSERDVIRVGAEYQRYRLNDWWAPVANSMMMGPNTFWNINNGQRDRNGVFAEVESQWNSSLFSLLGVRYEQVEMDTGRVRPYAYTGDANATMMQLGMQAADITAANKLNSANRKRTDNNIDLTALARYTPDQNSTYEGGYARKTRSPSLYERYTWGTGGMAMTMNNWVNDGNGYVGNVDLKPEVAHTFSASGDWHDAAKTDWGVKITPYFTRVDNYIDAKCQAACTAGRFNYLTLVNQDARLYGLDLSGFSALGRLDGIGSFIARGIVGYVNGKNRTTGDNLYNIMPLNAKLALEHHLGNWSNSIEGQLVGAKDDVSSTRGEMKTAGYGLLNLRSSYDTKHYRVDIGLENALNKQYSLPLGGAYIGQGATMSLNGAGAPYGITVPGSGRSLYAGVNLKF
jgi:iron complex outermembrane receptor protein